MPQWMTRLVTYLAALAVALAVTSWLDSGSHHPLHAQSATAGFDQSRLANIDTVVSEAIADRKLPGAVVLVGRGDRIVWRKAYGQRAVLPSVEGMTTDTIFD